MKIVFNRNRHLCKVYVNDTLMLPNVCAMLLALSPVCWGRPTVPVRDKSGVSKTVFFQLVLTAVSSQPSPDHSAGWETLVSVAWHFTIHPSLSCNVKLKSDGLISISIRSNATNTTDWINLTWVTSALKVVGADCMASH